MCVLRFLAFMAIFSMGRYRWFLSLVIAHTFMACTTVPHQEKDPPRLEEAPQSVPTVSEMPPGDVSETTQSNPREPIDLGLDGNYHEVEIHHTFQSGRGLQSPDNGVSGRGTPCQSVQECRDLPPMKCAGEWKCVQGQCQYCKDQDIVLIE